MNFTKISKDLVETLRSFDKLLIYIKGSPDPDAIASAYALKLLCSKFNIETDIVSPVQISLPQNQSFIKKINIPISFSENLSFDKYQGYVILDHQSTFISQNIKIPCILHIDHHEKDPDSPHANYQIISNEANSVSTILSLVIKELSLKFDPETTKKLYTALLFGLYTDTNTMDISSSLDKSAEEYLKEFADTDFITELNNSLFSEETLTIISSSIMNHQIYKNWLIAGVGYIKSNHRDSIAIAADFLLERDDISTVVVFAIIENKEEKTLVLDASFRTNSDNFDLNQFIKTITPNGGGRKRKGAFQVNLSYFFEKGDKKELLKLVNKNTIELLKERRDDIHLIEFKGFFNKLKSGISNWFN